MHKIWYSSIWQTNWEWSFHICRNRIGPFLNISIFPLIKPAGNTIYWHQYDTRLRRYNTVERYHGIATVQYHGTIPDYNGMIPDCDGTIPRNNTRLQRYNTQERYQISTVQYDGTIPDCHVQYHRTIPDCEGTILDINLFYIS